MSKSRRCVTSMSPRRYHRSLCCWDSFRRLPRCERRMAEWRYAVRAARGAGTIRFFRHYLTGIVRGGTGERGQVRAAGAAKLTEASMPWVVRDAVDDINRAVGRRWQGLDPWLPRRAELP